MDTIAAVATAVNNAGIGIIRISGEESLSIADKIFVNKKKEHHISEMKSHTIRYGYIMEDNNILDEVLLSYMKGPKSFTAEDVIEINCHGGILVIQKILDLVVRNGARLAEPGEFTKRAFLNGRIDLSQAEAVMDLISSENDQALRNSVGQLQGHIYQEVKDIRDLIIYEIAFIESALDDPEHISLEGYPEKLYDKINTLSQRIQKLIESYDKGKVIRSGINTVILGKPNAGKSSFLNLVVGEEKAIVTDIAGTTRDILEENVKLRDVTLHIIDTAGIRETNDVIEKIGVKKAKDYAEHAQLIIYIVDSTVALDQSDQDISKIIEDKKCIVLYNKTDLEAVVSVDDVKHIVGNEVPVIKISAKTREGMDLFEQKINEMFFQGRIQQDNGLIVTNVRHKEALDHANQSLNNVKKSIQNEMPEDFYSIDLMSAYTELGAIIGEEVDDDLVNEIFSRFCMGK